MSNKHSMLDIAFETLSQNTEPMTFASIWERVVTELQFNESKAEKKISTFYTDLMLDSRFVSLENNVWDLRVRHKYDEVHKAISEVESVDLDDEEMAMDEEISFVEEAEPETENKSKEA